MTKAQIQQQIAEMQKKLEDTRESAAWNSGPVNDTLKVIIPMMEDHLKIMWLILERTDA